MLHGSTFCMAISLLDMRQEFFCVKVKNWYLQSTSCSIVLVIVVLKVDWN